MGLEGNKKGIAVFMSWVLLILIVVSLGVIFYSWARNYTKTTTTALVTSDDTSMCDSASLYVEDSCQSQDLLYVDVENNGNVKFKGCVFSMVSLFGYTSYFRINKTVNVGNTKRFVVPKEGFIKQLQISPVLTINGKDFVCSKNSFSLLNISYCG